MATGTTPQSSTAARAFAFARDTAQITDSAQWQVASLARSLLRESFDQARHAATRGYAVDSLVQRRADELERRAHQPGSNLGAQRSALVRHFTYDAERIASLVGGRLETAIDERIDAALAAHVTGTTPIPGIHEGQPGDAVRFLIEAQTTALAAGEPLAPGVEDYQAGGVTYALRALGESVARDVAGITPALDIADIVGTIAADARNEVARQSGDATGAQVIGVDQAIALHYAVQDLVRDLVGGVSVRAAEAIASAHWQRVADGLGGIFQNVTAATLDAARRHELAAPDAAAPTARPRPGGVSL